MPGPWQTSSLVIHCGTDTHCFVLQFAGRFDVQHVHRVVCAHHDVIRLQVAVDKPSRAPCSQDLLQRVHRTGRSCRKKHCSSPAVETNLKQPPCNGGESLRSVLKILDRDTRRGITTAVHFPPRSRPARPRRQTPTHSAPTGTVIA